jgi:thiosulfate/3-mercaptopyruvate sulfurtransferase
MRPPLAAVWLLLASSTLLSVARAAEYPLSDAKVRVGWGTAKQTLKVSGRWDGTLAGAPPTLAGATLRAGGAFGEGGTPTITLATGAWRTLPRERGYKYVDPSGAAGGIRSVVLKNGRNGRPGVLRISGRTGFSYDHRAPHSRVGVALEVGLDRWCALIEGPDDVNGRVVGKGPLAPAGCAPDVVVDAAWLAARLGDPAVQVIDTRAAFGGAHVPGALPLRPEHLATTVDGVDLQLMPAAQAQAVLAGIGLRRDATVVVYGVAPEYDPARVTWALSQFGHPDVRYLDGGWNAWTAAGGPTAPGAPVAATPSGYTIDAQRDLRVTGAQVLGLLGAPPYDAPLAQLVDARTAGEYAAGRIPTATFAPWGDNLSSGLLRPRAELEDLYAGFGFDPAGTTITYCLVGWRASVAWLTLTWLGFADARVYDGSWLEWGAGGFPIETD